MTSATITTKGRITLPKGLREQLGIEAGDRLEFIELEQGFLVIPATRDIRALKGIVHAPRPPVSLKTMNKVLRKMGRVP